MKENKGCLIFIGLIIIVIGIVCGAKTYKRSDNYMIKDARSQNSISGFETYLFQHPNGKHINEAYDSLFSKCSNHPNESTAIEVYEIFKGTSLGDSLYNLIECRSQRDYEEARSLQNENLWSTYICRYPDDFKRDAEDQLKSLKLENEKKKWGTELEAWKTASSINTRDAYEKYLNIYPQGAHKKKAIDAIVNAILGEEHGELPAMDRTSYSSNSYSSIVIQNSTSYTLTLLYSGKDSKRIELSSGEQKNIYLPNGTYRIAASVDASNVRSYAGSESLDGGSYSVQYYISSYGY